MTLRKRAFLIVTGTALALIVTLLLLGRRIIINGVLQVEEEIITLDVLRVVDALTADVDRISSTCLDWAAWNDTYDFMLDGNPRYVEENLGAETFKNLKVNLIAFVDDSGAILHAKALDFERGDEIPGLTRALAAQLSRNPHLLQGGVPGRKGILALPEVNLLVASGPILRSDRSGAPRGTIVFARLLDADHLARIARITHLEARIQSLADPLLPAAIRTRVLYLSETAPVAVRPLGFRKVAGYTRLEDLSGRPVLVLEVEELRAIYVQGVKSLSYFVAALLVTGLAFGGLVNLLFERLVLSRLLRFTGRVREIGIARDLSQRIGFSGDDEVSALAGEVNAMLAQLQESEIALRRARDELEERVRERTAELETVNESLRGQIRERTRAEDALRRVKEELERQNVELRKLDRMKDALISDVSHELRTPVAKHAMQLELLRGELTRRGIEEDLRGFVEVMENSVRRQRSVISNILTLSRLEAGGRACRFEPVRLDDLLGEVVEDYRHALESCGVSVLVNLPPLSVVSDRDLLWHVFSNLVNNAIKFRGRVAPWIEVSVVVEDDRVRLRIADNGVGLGQEALARIFQRFYQETAAAEGIGLGLHIVQMILERLGGQVALASPGVGLGTVAEVVLPLVPPAAKAVAPWG